MMFLPLHKHTFTVNKGIPLFEQIIVGFGQIFD